MPVNSKTQVHTVFLKHIIPYIQVNNGTNDSVLRENWLDLHSILGSFSSLFWMYIPQHYSLGQISSPAAVDGGFFYTKSSTKLTERYTHNTKQHTSKNGEHNLEFNS